jgi:hypothetical protein
MRKTGIKSNMAVFWDVTLCSLIVIDHPDDGAGSTSEVSFIF